MTERAIRIVVFVVGSLIIIGAMFILQQCARERDLPQVTQTELSGDAMANAAQSAVETIGNYNQAERETDVATANTQGTISHAQSPDAIRDAVLDGLCRSSSHRNDPACKVR